MEVAVRRREQEVWQACDDLWALSGDISGITGDAIRERLVVLGKSRGSPNEIYKYRKTWFKSRNISADREIVDEGDPISRAVRLVHENLQSETDQKVAKLQQEHELELLKKDEELIFSKKALDSLMEEYSLVQKKLDDHIILLEAKTAQYLAEIEVRKALERENTLNKALAAQQLQTQENLLAELKRAHYEENLRAQNRESELLNELKRMGQEYSENITTQKIAIYNQEQANIELLNETSRLENEILAAKEKLVDKDKKISWLMNENNQMADKISEKSAELLVKKTSLDILAADRKTLNISLKRAEIEVAKLRIMAKAGQRMQ
jgi:hypothetical protein